MHPLPRRRSVDTGAAAPALHPAWPVHHTAPRMPLPPEPTTAAGAMALGMGMPPGPISAPAHITTFSAATSSARRPTGAPIAPPAAAKPGGDGGGVKTISLAGARERKRHNSWAGSAASGPGGPANVQVSRCDQPGCTKAYAGPNAVSNLKRHKANVHHIPLSAQPRHTRWDNNPNRPKDEQERRERMLEAKRKYARKARARQKAAQLAAKAGLHHHQRLYPVPGQAPVPGPVPLPLHPALCPVPALARVGGHPAFPLMPTHAPRQTQAQAAYPGLFFYTPQMAQVPLPSPLHAGGSLPAAVPRPRPHSVPATHISLPPVPDEPIGLLQPLAASGGNSLGLLSEEFGPFPSLEGLTLGSLAPDACIFPPSASDQPGLLPIQDDPPAFPPSSSTARWSTTSDATDPSNGLSLSHTPALLPLSLATLAGDDSEVGMSSTDTQITVPSVGGAGDASPQLAVVKLEFPAAGSPRAPKTDMEPAAPAAPHEAQAAHLQEEHGAPYDHDAAEDPDTWTCGLLRSPSPVHGGSSSMGASLSPWKTWLGPQPDAVSPLRPSSGRAARRGWERVLTC